MTEWEKAQAGYLYDANNDPALAEARARCADLCHELNMSRPSDVAAMERLLGEIVGSVGEGCFVTAPFYCDYGSNVRMGDGFYANHNCTILDAAPVCFGDRVFVGPNCVFSTSGHPLDVGQRARGLEFALPITVGDDVWFGAGVTVLPGVTIGSGSVIGAGSVVTRDVPANSIAVGSPARVVREIGPEDTERYPRCPED